MTCSHMKEEIEKVGSGRIFLWFPVPGKSNFDATVALPLRQRGYTQFLAAHRVRTRSSDRLKNSKKCLFAGYGFCRFDSNDRLPILGTTGVVNVVGIRSKIRGRQGDRSLANDLAIGIADSPMAVPAVRGSSYGGAWRPGRGRRKYRAS